MNGQITSVQNEISGMRQRLDALEALGGRVAAVEREAQTLRTDLSAAETQIQALQRQTRELAAQTEQLAAQTAELQQRTRVFQSFLDGLRELLLGLPAVEAK
jgi:predicted  nucleic acid-binding Zn-ribbon protein